MAAQKLRQIRSRPSLQMKFCPLCKQTFKDDNVNFCRQDGTPLVIESWSQSDTQQLLGKVQPGIGGSIHSQKQGVSNIPTTSATLTQTRRPRKSKTIDSLAVLPFVNVSQDPGTDYLSEGITESIINSLSPLPKLRVMARSTVFRYRDRAVDPSEVGKALGVRAVVSGRVNHFGDRLMINTELVDVSDGSQLWGQQYNLAFADIFEVQEEIAREISEMLRMKLTGAEKKQLVKRYTENSKAYQLYLKGRFFWAKRTPESLKKGIDCFQQAIDVDPDYALAYVGIADCYIHRGGGASIGLRPSEGMAKAKVATQRALSLDDTLAEAHTSLAYVKLLYDWDWQASEKEYQRAIELNPKYTEAHHSYSHYLTAMGRSEESLAESLRSLELEPLDLLMNVHLAWHYLMAREPDLAVTQLHKTLELEANSFQAHLYLGQAYEFMKLYEDAVVELQRAKGLSEASTEALAALGHAYATLGRREDAQSILNRFEQLSREVYVSPYLIATVHLGLEEKDKAFESLEKAFVERDQWMIYLKVDPIFDTLRTESHYAELVKRVGLTNN
ncbi:MAG TPA: hypothetical protein DCK93_00390 [Blastocatellia bacterium]|nr:hypothetical protein [Blastocatellia bacterium]